MATDNAVGVPETRFRSDIRPILFIDVDGVLLRRRNSGILDAFELATGCLEISRMGDRSVSVPLVDEPRSDRLAGWNPTHFVPLVLRSINPGGPFLNLWSRRLGNQQIRGARS